MMRAALFGVVALLCACAASTSAQQAIDPSITAEQAGVSQPLYNLTIERQGAELLEPRIWGGANAPASDNPWQVALVRTDSLLPNDVFCGGALIAPDWVLTAAHCVNGTNMTAAYFNIVEGTNNLARTGGGRRIDPARVFVHPAFIPTPPNTLPVRNYNDIALIRLARPAQATPIAFADASLANIAADTPARVTGWGRMRGGLTPELLQFLDVNVVSNAVCGRPTIHGARIRDTMICAMKPNTRTGFCSGDSGGPLTIAAGSGRIVVGVVSVGEQSCSQRNIPGVYTRVSSFAPWIRACLDYDEAKCRTG